MFLRSLALSLALLGAASAADPPGCHPAYASGKYYAAGDVVSAKGELTITEDCDPKYAGCPQSGKKAVTKTMNFNYECETEEWCTNSGYAPGDIYSDLAWKMDGAPCEGNAVIEPAIAPLPFLGGCPAEFSDSGEYGSGDRVSVCKIGNEWCSIYVCKADTPSLWCSMFGYEPGASLYWDQAWDKVEGSCSGTIAPTPAVTIDAANVVGGCPSAYDSGTKYKAGDRVSKDNVVFECKPWPFDGWCGLVGYEPMPDVAIATPDAWNEAWNIIGYCSGTIAPTSAPNFVSLKKLGGCPAEWELGTNGFGYDEGDRVAKDRLVFQCKRWPFSAHCGQAGYEPLSTEWNDAWKDAWTIVGYCEGTLSPSSVGGLLLEGKNLGECPLREHKIGDEYDGGELVKVCEQADVECCAVYKCAADLPNPSGWCGLNEAYSPGEGFAWKDAWSLEGYCCGHGPSSSPTQPPSPQPSTKPSVSGWPTSQPSESPSTSTRPSLRPSTSNRPSSSSVPSSQPSCSGVELEVDITTSISPYKTSWSLRNLCTGEIEAQVEQGQSYTEKFTTYTDIVCVPKSKYEMVFVIKDGVGDGLSGVVVGAPDGSYTVKYDGFPVASGGGWFGFSERSEFGDACPSAKPSIQPTLEPSISIEPTVSSKPSLQPSISSKPSTSTQPSLKPSVSSRPSASSQPTVCAQQFIPLAGNGGNLLTTVSNCIFCLQEVDLPSTYTFFGVYPTDSIEVYSSGVIQLGADLQVWVAAHPDRNPEMDGGIYTKTNVDGSFTISYEGVTFSSGDGEVNAQATLFEDGRVSICFGTGSTPSGVWIQSYLYDYRGFYFYPNTLPGFVNGYTDLGVYPAPGCFCYDPNV